eukprot:1431157-Prymnesium_polylepis.1
MSTLKPGSPSSCEDVQICAPKPPHSQLGQPPGRRDDSVAVPKRCAPSAPPGASRRAILRL